MRIRSLEKPANRPSLRCYADAMLPSRKRVNYCRVAAMSRVTAELKTNNACFGVEKTTACQRHYCCMMFSDCRRPPQKDSVLDLYLLRATATQTCIASERLVHLRLRQAVFRLHRAGIMRFFGVFPSRDPM